MTEFNRVAIASRVFSLAAIVGLAGAFGNQEAFALTFLLAGVAAVASYVSSVGAGTTQIVVAVEASLSSLIVVIGLPDSVALLPYLVVLPLLTGLAGGIVGASLVIVCQLAVMVAGMATEGSLSDISTQVELLAPWVLTIVGGGSARIVG